MTMGTDAARRIAAAVASIPSGQVRSYAQVAVMAGLPGHARQVARVLAGSSGLPWHRVLRADGSIAFAPDSSQAQEQARRLCHEGVPVINGRVALAWRPTRALDGLLWGPR